MGERPTVVSIKQANINRQSRDDNLCQFELERTSGSTRGVPGAAVSRGDAVAETGTIELAEYAGMVPVSFNQATAEPSQINSGVGVASPPSPSLVTPTHNSAIEAKSLIYPDLPYQFLASYSQWETRPTVHGSCPNARMVKMTCEAHGTPHWLTVPCKRRDCPVCGPVSRFRIAQRITNGIVKFGMVPEVRNMQLNGWHYLCAWIVLTFPYDVDKEDAVERLGDFIRWLRKRLGRKLEYVATYEKTKKGRLHINLLIGPWSVIEQRELEKRWGARLWVAWVRDDDRMGKEASAASLGGYIAKVEQAVTEGRRVSYSRGWPKFDAIARERKGKINTWSTYARGEFRLSFNEMVDFEAEKQAGIWVEFVPGEFKVRGPDP